MSITITGAASGMGRATALLAARLGARVTLSDLNSEAGEQVAAEIAAAGGTAQFIRCDVSDEGQVAALVAAAVATYGRLDGGLNNAGRPTSASCSTN